MQQKSHSITKKYPLYYLRHSTEHFAVVFAKHNISTHNKLWQSERTGAPASFVSFFYTFFITNYINIFNERYIFFTLFITKFLMKHIFLYIFYNKLDFKKIMKHIFSTFLLQMTLKNVMKHIFLHYFTHFIKF